MLAVGVCIGLTVCYQGFGLTLQQGSAAIVALGLQDAVAAASTWLAMLHIQPKVPVEILTFSDRKFVSRIGFVL